MTRHGRWLAALLAAPLAVAVAAGPAAADPPGPTSYRSQVVELEPAVDGIELRVLGGDSFLQLVNDGHEVVVPGYEEREQYLRFDPDGTVWVNLRSEAHWQNADRYGVQGSAVPTDAGPDQPPRWEQVADAGNWAWHDHRIHWMSPNTLPGTVDTATAEPQLAFEWPVSLVVDGREVTVTGSLTWLPPASPLATVLAALLAAGLAVVLARRLPAAAAIAATVGLGVVATGVVAVTATVGLPPGVQAEPLPLILVVVTLAVVGAGLAMRSRSPFGTVVAGAAGVPLVVWALTQWAAVTAPVVPPDGLPAWWSRMAVGVAGAAGLAAIAIGLRDLFARPLALDDA